MQKVIQAINRTEAGRLVTTGFSDWNLKKVIRIGGFEIEIKLNDTLDHADMLSVSVGYLRPDQILSKREIYPEVASLDARGRKDVKDDDDKKKI